jgi:hypothetical protein
MCSRLLAPVRATRDETLDRYRKHSGPFEYQFGARQMKLVGLASLGS